MNFEKTVILKNYEKVLLRFPKIGDAQALTDYINKLSQEDTFLLVSGETFTLMEEQNYLNNWLKEIQAKNRAQILAFTDNKIIGNVEVNRMTKRRNRSLHVGEIAISVAKDYRGKGLGKILMSEIIESGKSMGLRQLYLTTFSINETAQILYKKLGFIEAGEIPEHIFYKGKYIGQKFLYLTLK